MKRVNGLIVSILTVIFIFGCTKDILEKNPVAAFSPDNFYNNETEAHMALMGVYASIIPNNFSLHWFQFDFMSDNNYIQDSWQGSKEFGEWAHNSSSLTASEKWAKAYQTIGRANAFLENLDAMDNIGEGLKLQMKAEARFLRAYMYNDLILFYGDVPLILEVQSLDDAIVPRTPKQEVLVAILEDFNFASDNLPLNYPGDQVGRATKGAALAFKTRALLYNEEWEKAAAAAQAVIDFGVYELYEDYEGLFKEVNENNVEVIFDIQYVKDLRPQTFPTSAVSFGEWPTPNVTLDLINSYYMLNGLPIDDPNSGYQGQDPYTNRDPRLAASVVLPGSQMGDGILIPANDVVITGARPRKYADLGTSNRQNTAINTILMRYADVLLMRAEALIEMGNTGQEVYDLINKVRDRVGMPSIGEVEGADLSQEELREILRHERRIEFFIEGTRYSDMYRWQDESLVHDVYGYNTSKLSDPSNPSTWVFEEVNLATRNFDPAKGWLWPIPLSEIQNNEKLTQNSGY